MSNISLSQYGNIPLNTKLNTTGLNSTPYVPHQSPGWINSVGNFLNPPRQQSSYTITPVNGTNQATGNNNNGGYGNNNALAASAGGNSAIQPYDQNVYNNALNTLNNNTNDYYNQQGGFYQKNHDIQQQGLDTQNTLALGTQDQAAKDAFLNQVYNPLMKQEGSLQYKYGLDTGNNDALFGLQSTANQQNRDLALSKLATDEQNNLAQLGLSHGNQNASTIDSLNSRGMLYGQAPTGMYQDQNIGGLHGLAGQQAGLVNTDFANQRNQIVQPYQLGVQGANQAYTQQQGLDTQNHLYNGQTYGYDAANGINNQNMNYTTQTNQNNNQLAMYQASLNNAKQKELYNNQGAAKNQALQQSGSYLYG